MNEVRQLPARDYLARKAAFRELIAAAGGVVAAAKITRVSESRISMYGSPNEMTCFAPDDVVGDLEATVGDPICTREAARQAGFVLVAESAIAKPLPVIDRATAELLTHGGELIRQLGESLLDGVCSPEEATAAKPAAERLKATVHTIDEALAARATAVRGR